ncbi:MAG: DUF599 domain-containing protein [Bacteroidetes bacterium]|nr:DUF599 domain-containing protein [Bacteroidota bacterium]
MHGILSDVAALGISVGLIGLYHLYIWIRQRRTPFYTTQAVNHDVRAEWVRWIHDDESRSILAIQTLRNSTMAATFLASTAVLLMMGTLNLMQQADKLSGILVSAGMPDPEGSALWLTKMLFLVADYFIAFFCFAMSVRLYNHVGYQINVPADPRKEYRDVNYVLGQMKNAGRYYTLGMRAYYISVPFVFWIFGAHLMVITSILLVFVLFVNDRAPQQKNRKAGPRKKA